MKVVTLPTGGTASFRDPEEILGRGKKALRGALMSAFGLVNKVPAFQEGKREDETNDEFVARLGDEIAKAQLDPADFEALENVREAAVIAQLDSWSLGIPLPTMRTLATLNGDLYDALLAAVGNVPGEALGAGFSENSDPESPTPDSES
jgi:hypothetical protein